MTKSSTKNTLGPVALLISMYFPPDPGGGATAAWNRALILQKIGYTVFVLCGFPSYPSGKVVNSMYKGKFFHIEKMQDFTLLRLRLLPIESKGYLRRLILFINFIFLSLIYMQKILRISSQIELVYSLAPIMFSSFIGFLYSKVTRSFFIYEASALWPEELVAFKTKLFFIVSSFGKMLAKLSYAIPDIIVVISDTAAEYVTNNYKPKVLVYALPIGVEPSTYFTKSKESSRKVLIEKRIFTPDIYNKFIVLYAGVLSKVTRVENLVYAANKLKDDENEIIFLVIGEGEEKARLEEIKVSRNIHNLFFLPFQDSAFVPYILSAADVCVISLSTEPIYEATLPTKFFDYLACHKPLIGICVGEVENIINSNNIGLTVKDGEIDNLAAAILSIKNSPALMHSMQENSHIVLKDFSLDNLALKFNKVLKKEILKNKKKNLKKLTR